MSQYEERVACPYCREMILPGALKCKECGSNLRRRWCPPPEGMIWTRNPPGRKLLGVAACLAHNFRVSPTFVRLTFVLLTFVSFLGLVLYLALWAILPPAPGQPSAFDRALDAFSKLFHSIGAKRQAACAGATEDRAAQP